MADLTALEESASATGHADTLSRLAQGLLLVAPLVALAILRLAHYGWADVAPDDARYLNVGLAVLAGRGPITPDGNPFLLRSPTYGIALALGAKAIGGDPLVGARLVAASLTLLAFCAAVRLGWVLRGLTGAAITCAAILATPLIWRLLPTLRIDLAQTAVVIGVVLALRRPTTARWAVAGGLFGLSLLIKETGALVGLLPLAWLGILPVRRWLPMAAIFGAAALLVAGWWWIFVWSKAGVLFPLNAIGVIERRDVTGALRIGRATLPFVAVFVAAWLVTARNMPREVGARLLCGAALALVPPALYATVNGLGTRNYAPLALLSCVAVGVAGADVIRTVIRRIQAADVDRPIARAIPAALAVLLLPAVALGQQQVGRPGHSALPEHLSAWLVEHAGPSDRVVMTFRLAELVALELNGRVPLASLTATRVTAGEDPAAYIWMGLRDRQLFGYPRDGWIATLGAPGTRYLVTVEPHPLTPVELLPLLESASGPSLGFRTGVELRDGKDVALVLEVEPGTVASGGSPSALRLHMSPAAVEAWLALYGGPSSAAAGNLARAQPVVVGDAAGIRRLDLALGSALCSSPAGSNEPAGAITLRPC